MHTLIYNLGCALMSQYSFNMNANLALVNRKFYDFALFLFLSLMYITLGVCTINTSQFNEIRYILFLSIIFFLN